MNSPASDTVQVRLSAAGIAAAQGGKLSIHGGRVTLEFVGDAPQAVHRAVWIESLATTAPFGKPWFELVPVDAAKPVASTTPSAK
jgi:hypothetical protein